MNHPEEPIRARQVWTVTRLNAEVRALLEASFATLWVEGELSNLARPRSGHIYFSLKDDGGQVRCAMFRMHNRRLGFDPGDGMQVLVQARVSLYAERGDYQLIVQGMEEAGAGALQRAFDALKRRLAGEGLFDADRKRDLPRLPRRIGVITSPSGAAIRDVLSTLARRFPSIPVLVYPVPVQGVEAAPAIVRALDRASEDGRCDVLILARGGGSLEDLWAFNEEVVARAIARSRVPVVSAVGHEVDFTIADFVADQRAATPTAAAELVSPDAREWRARRDQALRRLHLMARGRVREERQALAWLMRQLRHPARHLEDLRRRHLEFQARLRRTLRTDLEQARQRTVTLVARLGAQRPRQRIREGRRQTGDLRARLERTTRVRLTRERESTIALLRALDTVSPQRTLDRGYAIVTRDETGALLRDPAQVRAGEHVSARLAGGVLPLKVRDD